jgi:hypothetical protein
MIMGLRSALCCYITTLRRWNKYWNACWPKWTPTKQKQTPKGNEGRYKKQLSQGGSQSIGKEMTVRLEAMIQNNQERMEAHHTRTMVKMDSRL